MTAPNAPLRVVVPRDAAPFPKAGTNGAEAALEVVPCPDAPAAAAAVVAGRADVAWLALDAQGSAPLVPVAYPVGQGKRSWVLLALRGGPVTGTGDLPGHRLALAEQDQHARALMVLNQAGRFGDDAFGLVHTRGSDAARDVLRCMLSGTVEAGLVDGAFWDDMMARAEVPKGAFDVVWSSGALPTHALFAPAHAGDAVLAFLSRGETTDPSWVAVTDDTRAAFAVPPGTEHAPEVAP